MIPPTSVTENPTHTHTHTHTHCPKKLSLALTILTRYLQSYKPKERLREVMFKGLDLNNVRLSVESLRFEKNTKGGIFPPHHTQDSLIS